MTIQSSFTIGPAQADGKQYVEELHIDSDGQEYRYAWVHDGVLVPQMVMEERVLLIQRVLDNRAAARAAVVGTEVPLTRHDFKTRLTSQERIAIRERAKTDPYAEDFMDLLNTSGVVYLTLARPGLAYLESVGVLTAERAAAVGAE